MTERLLLGWFEPTSTGDGSDRLDPGQQGRSSGGVTVRLPRWVASPGVEDAALRRTRAAAEVPFIRDARRFARRVKRFVVRRTEMVASSAAWWDLSRSVARAARSLAERGLKSRAEELCGAYAPLAWSTDAPFDAIRARRLVVREAGLLQATFSLPASILTEPAVLDRIVSILESHAEEPFSGVTASDDDLRTLAAGHVVARLTGLPLELTGDAPHIFATPEERLFARFVRARAAVSLAPMGVAAASWPIVTALIEATSDSAALRTSIEALQANELANWEAIVVVDEADAVLCDAVAATVDAIGDTRVRMLGSRLELLDLYSGRVQHAARADHFIRIRPGFRVDRDLVARIAPAVLRPEPVAACSWIGRVSKPYGTAPTLARALEPMRIDLREVNDRWYSLEGEYVMDWRTFRFFGGFTHSSPEVHSSQVEEIVLCESSALNGLLFESEVPLAYKRMAALSKRIGRTSRVPATYAHVEQASAEDLDASDPAALGSDEFAGRTILFVRHHLVGYDSRMLKEAGTLLGMGARVVVLGGADEPPASLVEHGLEVITLPRSGPTHSLGAIYERIAPDVVHAYDVLSWDLIEPLLRPGGPRLVYECRDLITAPGYLPEATRGLQLAREREIIDRADAVVAVSDPSAEWLEAEYGIGDVTVIAHGSMEVARQPSPVGSPVRLLFQGAFRPNRGLFTLVTAVRSLKGRAHLTFQGFGAMEDALREYVRAEGLEDEIDFIESCGPLEVVPAAVPFDIGVICYAGSTENLRRTVPNKLVDYMSAGLALVATDLPGIRSIADDSDGVFFEPGSAHDLACAIEPLISKEGAVAAHKASALEKGRALRWEREQEKLAILYRRVLGAPASGGRPREGRLQADGADRPSAG